MRVGRVIKRRNKKFSLPSSFIIDVVGDLFFFSSPREKVENERKKETKNTFLAIKYNGELSEPNLVNDLDGGMSFGRDINYYAESEKEYLVQLVNPIDLKTFVSSNSFIKGIPKNLDKKVEFQKLVNTLRETDNPVLMMARLKR